MKTSAAVRLGARIPELLLVGAGLACLAWWAASFLAMQQFQRNATRALESEGTLSTASGAAAGEQRPVLADAGSPAVVGRIEAPAAPARARRPASAKAGSPALVGRIEIPAASISAIIAEGADAHTLRLAVGHLPGTALPGSSGRSALAGHRDTFFRGLGRVRLGDPIRVTTAAGSFSYRVVATRVVSPHAIEVTRTGPDPGLILITCYPFEVLGAAPYRFVVVAAETGREPRPTRASREPDRGTVTAGAHGAAG